MGLKKHGARGFSLLEVLVAIVLITLGFLSMLALQASSMQHSSMAYYHGIASQIGNGLAASIRANPDGLAHYNHAYSPAGTIGNGLCRDTLACNTAQIAASDIAWARQSARLQLPNGDIQVARGQDFVNVTLVWQEPSSTTTDSITSTACAEAGIAGADRQTRCLIMQVRL